MSVLLTDNDPAICAWLRQLIADGHLPPGDVLERSICDVQGSDVEGYRHQHYFCGIGGWPLALRLAGWPDDLEVWSGSAPCQPFSAAGKRQGANDERDLWPAFFRLIRERRPERVVGEQVASAIGHGWLDRVSADLEKEGYAVGAIVLGAHSVGAPHIRQRLFWVADASVERRQQIGSGASRDEAANGRQSNGDHVAASNGANGGLGLAVGAGLERHAGHGDDRNESRRIDPDAAGSVAETSGACAVADTECAGVWSGGRGSDESASGRVQGPNGQRQRVWSDAGASRVIKCVDGKHRRIPIEPAFFPLADVVPARVVRLRGYGNAIQVETAAAFIAAYMDIAGITPRRRPDMTNPNDVNDVTEIEIEAAARAMYLIRADIHVGWGQANKTTKDEVRLYARAALLAARAAVGDGRATTWIACIERLPDIGADVLLLDRRCGVTLHIKASDKTGPLVRSYDFWTPLNLPPLPPRAGTSTTKRTTGGGE